MTPKEKYRRIRAWSRANKRAVDMFLSSNTPSEQYLEARLEEHEHWSRLPANLQRAIVAPEGGPQ